MADAAFQIDADPVRNLITIRFERVFWDHDTATRFKHSCLAAIASLGCAPGQHLVLVDLRNAILQSQGVIERMQSLIGGASAGRIALVAASPLARMQTKRLQIRESVVLFAEMPAAEEWLFAAALEISAA